MSTVCMIPARIGSKRVPKKNLRYLGEKPLICYAIEAAIESEAFDSIYLNSDGIIFNEIADRYGINFYLRDSSLANDDANNDVFVFDFLKNIKCDNLIQLLPTSPFIKADTIIRFTRCLTKSHVSTVVSVARHQIASIYDNRPLNFSYNEPHVRSQDMRPVYAYATVLMGWNSHYFLERMIDQGFAYHGQENEVVFFEIDGLETIDIDNESDFRLAEAVLPFWLSNSMTTAKKRYYESNSV